MYLYLGFRANKCDWFSLSGDRKMRRKGTYRACFLQFRDIFHTLPRVFGEGIFLRFLTHLRIGVKVVLKAGGAEDVLFESD